jgi:ribosome-binding factor A
MSWDRFEKLVTAVRQKVANVILYRLKDPRVGFVTVTKIDLARDLKTCTVFYSVVGTEGDKSRTAKALEDARGFIQTEVGRSMRTRTVPHIDFRYDDSMEKSERINRILRDIRVDEDWDEEEGGSLPGDALEEPSSESPHDPLQDSPRRDEEP